MTRTIDDDDQFLKDFSERMLRIEWFSQNILLTQEIIKACENSLDKDEDAEIVQHFSKECYAMFPHKSCPQPHPHMTEDEKIEYRASWCYMEAFWQFGELYNELHKQKYGINVGQAKNKLSSAFFHASKPYEMNLS